MKRVLIVAFHFPPFSGSSGVQRTLRFVQYLPEYGWEPIVLAPHPRAYERTDPSLLAALPSGLVVETAFCADTARHLAVMRRYPAWLARPDRWISWRLGAVPTGLGMIRRYRPQAIWSTYPIATAHLIGASLRALSGLPWVADFRDPMAQPGYPRDPATWRSFLSTEKSALKAACWTFTTPGAQRFYHERYAELQREGRTLVLENGYDEESFEAASLDQGDRTAHVSQITLLHSGIVYPEERDPTQLMEALQLLHERGSPWRGRLRLRFRASSHDEVIRRLAREHGVESMISLEPAIPYKEALREMLAADALLLMQAANCNEQIPAKIYEYLRTGRPMLALTDAAGDTADLVRRAGIPYLAPLDRAPAIAAALERLCEDIDAGRAKGAAQEFAAQFSRRNQTGILAGLLDRISEDSRARTAGG